MRYNMKNTRKNKNWKKKPYQIMTKNTEIIAISMRKLFQHSQKKKKTHS